MVSSPPSVVYALAVIGEELLPALRAMVEVGLKLTARNGQPATAMEHAQRLTVSA